jgi:hypothetical protein
MERVGILKEYIKELQPLENKYWRNAWIVPIVQLEEKSISYIWKLL